MKNLTELLDIEIARAEAKSLNPEPLTYAWLADYLAELRDQLAG